MINKEVFLVILINIKLSLRLWILKSKQSWKASCLHINMIRAHSSLNNRSLHNIGSICGTEEWTQLSCKTTKLKEKPHFHIQISATIVISLRRRGNRTVGLRKILTIPFVDSLRGHLHLIKRIHRLWLIMPRSLPTKKASTPWKTRLLRLVQQETLLARVSNRPSFLS